MDPGFDSVAYLCDFYLVGSANGLAGIVRRKRGEPLYAMVLYSDGVGAAVFYCLRRAGIQSASPLTKERTNPAIADVGVSDQQL